ncbi:hypothetical protein EPA93_44990 [Ktedonosporobacter rubrisoli]|uniref:LLM class flavin-dependent oxidoreductase n=1 Tax=Ktedonosporobacter rubrisoli TaxID=2509675 RepID=A0A4P6K3W8_KTERU|nr:hypothetical protein [Ktedonosporobacter rubrisoli]QBD82745.1 hypothetical protein EPA93_44990 [Ktedonosporobacter rubrisoli]
MAHIRLASPVFHISITNADPLTIAAQVGHYLGKRLFVPGQSVTPEQILDSPHFLIGAPERVCEILLDRRDRYGIANFTIVSEAMDSFAPIVAALKGK